MDMLKRSRIDKLVEKATNELLIEPDIETTLTICDLIRGQEISAKHAVASVKKRLQTDNANVVLHTLYVLEALMKNCGSSVHEEVATPDFMQTFISLTDKSHDVCAQVLSSIQNWAFVFKDKAGYSAIQDAYNELRSEGHSFPEFSENDAMFSVVCAPNWKEGSYCHRCKVGFTTFRRRHHCRNCGNSFCAECSSERAMLPQFGIEKEVRVCDHCFELLTRNPSQEKTVKEKKVQPNRDEQARREKERKERELQTREAEELELALALSASEAECKERERRGYGQSTRPAEANPTTYPNIRTENGPMQLLPVLDTSDMDPELARYLNRHYWENRATALNQGTSKTAGQETVSTSPVPQPSAPIYASPVPARIQASSISVVQNTMAGPSETIETENSAPSGSAPGMHLPGVPELTTQKQEEFLNALRASIEFFVNRMQSNSQRGRSIANDTTVQALFLTLHEMHPQLLQQKQAMEDRRAYFEGLQDKLTQLREAREALDALRQEHAARRQLEEQEAARLRQLQMMQKLEVMRQQKRDTLEYQRRMALEQTMQYQQQYQSQTQPMQHTIDPVTGRPLGTVHPPAYGMSVPGYAGVAHMPPSYLMSSTVSTYSPGPVDPSISYAQPPPSVADGSTYYHPAAMTTHPGGGQIYYGSQQQQQQQVGPAQPPTHQHATYTPGLYSMQTLEAALPPPGSQPDPMAMYQAQQYAALKQQQQQQQQQQQPPVAHDPNAYTSQHIYSELPDPPTTDLPRATTPSGSNYPQPSSYSQQPARETAEGQLISFD